MSSIKTRPTAPAGKKQGASAAPNVKRILLIVIPVVVLAAAVVVFLLTRPDKAGTDTPQATDDRPTVVSSDNAQSVMDSIDKPVEDGSYQVTMNLTWVFDGESSDAYVENSRNNTRTVYFDVFRADTNELVYSSPYIPVGEKLSGFALDTQLEPGSYNGLVTYHLVDDDHNEVSSLSVTVKLDVK